MIAATYITGVGSVLLIGAAGLLLLSGRGSERRLGNRVLGTRELKVDDPNRQNNVFSELASNTNPVLRFAKFLGYQPHLPAPYTISLKTVSVVAVAAAGLVFQLLRTLLPIWLSASIAAIVAVAVAALLFGRKNKAYQAALFRQIPDTMSLLLRAVRAGLPVTEAVRSVSRESMSPTREEFNRVAGEVALGMPIEDTLHRLYQRTLLQEYAFFSVVIGLHGQTGGNLAETLENLADMVRRRVAMAGKARALAAEGRLSATVVGVLPFVIGGLISVVNPEYMREFIDNPKGPMVIAVFAMLLALGIVTSHLLIQRSTRD